jgi:glucose 1-dehydrogenase
MRNKTTKRKNKMEFGVIGLGRMGGDLALQAIEKGWRVVGYIRSPERTRALAHDPAKRKQVLALIPSRRIGQPEEVAGAVLYLMSDEAAYVTGTTLFIDGGMTLYSSFLGQA